LAVLCRRAYWWWHSQQPRMVVQCVYRAATNKLSPL